MPTLFGFGSLDQLRFPFSFLSELFEFSSESKKQTFLSVRERERERERSKNGSEGI